jgi:uncharacterized membrane protein YhaH (DUF805 family)
MDRLKHMFSLTGRASRLDFWRFQAWQALVGGTVWCLAIFVTIAGGWLGLAPFLLLAPILAAGLCMSVRRLHDRNRSAWWFIAFGPGPYLLLMLAHLLADTLGGPIAALASLPLALGALALTVWSWVEIGFRRGTRGPNAFGAAPV